MRLYHERLQKAGPGRTALISGLGFGCRCGCAVLWRSAVQPQCLLTSPEMAQCPAVAAAGAPGWSAMWSFLVPRPADAPCCPADAPCCPSSPSLSLPLRSQFILMGISSLSFWFGGTQIRAGRIDFKQVGGNIFFMVA